MFSSIRKAKIIIPFFYKRLGYYGELARIDLIQFRNETIQTAVRAVVGAAALLLLLSFIGVAVIVTEWDTPNRVLTAWIVVLGWGLCAGAGVYLVGRPTRTPSPFSNIETAISRDLSVIKNPHNPRD